jgi:UDP-2,3-diacylglucosamine pyrophosphatase LpxH
MISSPNIEIYYDTIIVSDVHLGSNLSEAKKLLDFLKTMQFKRLILLGDIFADLNFSRLKREHWDLLSYLRKLSNAKRHIEVVWVIGNHDLGLVDVMSHLVGIEVFDKYEWMADNKRCVALHGHQFDPAMSNSQWVSDFFGWLYLQIQKIPGLTKGFPRWIDKISAHCQNLTEILQRRAIKYAAQHGYDVICCGHTHEAVIKLENNIEYYNSGCWVKKDDATCIAFSGSDIKIFRIQANEC